MELVELRDQLVLLVLVLVLLVVLLVLVLHDMLGLNERFTPKFLKRYADLAEQVRQAVRTFGEEVRAGRYPDAAHSYDP
jgi:ketopantoate hydroxymethyltransferase